MVKNQQRKNQIATLTTVVMLLAGQTSYAAESYEAWLKKDNSEFAAYEAKVTQAYGKYLEEDAKAFNAFVKAAAREWGKDNVWVPKKTTWVEYREDWKERSSVQFQDGTAKVEVIIANNATDADIKKSVADAVETLILSGSISPIEMMRRKLFPNRYKNSSKANGQRTSNPASSTASQITYTVKKGDSIWRVSRKFKVSRAELAEANGISPDSWLKIGQQLIIPEKTSENSPTPAASLGSSVQSFSRDPRLAPPDKAPLLAHQVKMPDGSEVTRKNARQFAESIAAARNYKEEHVTGSDGKKRRAVSASFHLVPNHIRIRAERFRPIILKYAAQEGVYAPLVFAIIHSESSFNPRARSNVPAYGLMQLVPRSGARDAYRYLYKKDRLVSGTYLYQPENNIQLGTAFLHLLGQRYFRRINNPMSRMLCSIAAYNTGAGNVCKAFGAGTSLSRAAIIINRMEPTEVYTSLRNNLPYAETREYVKRVSSRVSLYKEWK